MAYTVTLQSIADRARVHADMKSSGFISDTQILGIINEAYAELYDELVSSYENYFATTQDLTLIQGTDSYSLPTDFYKMLGVDYQVNNNAYITLMPYNESERNAALTTNVTIPSGVIRLRYVPAPTIFTSLSSTMDAVAGWDRLLTLLTAIDMLDAEESASGALTRKYERTLQRVRDMAAPRDAGMPATVSDVYTRGFQGIYGALRYRFYGNQIRFVNSEFLGSEQFPPLL